LAQVGSLKSGADDDNDDDDEVDASDGERASDGEVEAETRANMEEPDADRDAEECGELDCVRLRLCEENGLPSVFVCGASPSPAWWNVHTSAWRSSPTTL
jgi:hypothetical protein